MRISDWISDVCSSDLLGLNWIATSFTYQVAMPVWLGWVAVLLLSLFLAIYPAVATGLAWRFGRGDVFRFTLLFAAAWMLTEWLRGYLFTGFAWNPLGAVWTPLLPVAQSARDRKSTRLNSSH